MELSTLIAKLSPQSKLEWIEECIQVIKAEWQAYKHYSRCLTEENHIILQLVRWEKDKAIRKATKIKHKNRVSKVKNIKGL